MNITEDTQQDFDDTIDDATHSVMTAFELWELPRGEERSDLMVDINDALTQILAPIVWKKENP